MSPSVRAKCLYRILGKSQEWSVKNSMVDVTYLAAAWAPTAEEDGLILLADWGNWVCVFLSPLFKDHC